MTTESLRKIEMFLQKTANGVVHRCAEIYAPGVSAKHHPFDASEIESTVLIVATFNYYDNEDTVSDPYDADHEYYIVRAGTDSPFASYEEAKGIAVRWINSGNR